MRAVLALLLLVPALAFGRPATAVRATEIRSAPNFDSAALARLAEGQRLEAFERDRGWTRVRDERGNEGWVRMFLLRYADEGAAQPGDSGIMAALNAARTGSSGRQVTTGVRGLDAQQLTSAKPNAAELKKMQGFAASSDAAAKFAAQGPLTSQKVAYPKEGG
jgi:SH3-like domain-containing protein